MIKVNVIGGTFREGHLLKGCNGEMWISLSAAVAAFHYGRGTAIVFPDGGSLHVDERPDDLMSRAATESS